MQIDRARFLFLTASLAGGGCSANSPTDPVSPTTPAPTATEVTVTETPEPDDTSEPVVPIATAVPTVDPSATATQPAAGTCDNDTGTVPACTIAGPPGPFCEGLSDARSACKAYKGAFRGAIAAKAVACLNAASGQQAVCDYTKTEQCASEAIRTACIQPSTFNACSSAVSQCAGNSYSKLTMPDCQALLSSVKDGKRQAMITCMVEGCSLESCTWMLR